MVPVLHHYDAGSVNIKNLNRRQKRNFFFTSFTINDRFQSDRRSYDNIWSIKIRKIDDFFLFRKHFDSHSEEVILIVLIFFNFLLVFDYPLIKVSSFLFLSLRYSWHLLSLVNFLIFHEFLFNLLKNCLGITDIWRKDEIFSIGESFSFFALFKGLNAALLMLIHMSDNYFSELFNGLFLIVFYMDIINVTVYNFLSSFIFISWLTLFFFILLFHLTWGFFYVWVFQGKLRSSKYLVLH